MVKDAFAILMLVGIVLTAVGVSASESLSSEIARLFTGLPARKALWYLAAGLAAAAVGVTGLLRNDPPRNETPPDL